MSKRYFQCFVTNLERCDLPQGSVSRQLLCNLKKKTAEFFFFIKLTNDSKLELKDKIKYSVFLCICVCQWGTVKIFSQSDGSFVVLIKDGLGEGKRLNLQNNLEDWSLGNKQRTYLPEFCLWEWGDGTVCCLLKTDTVQLVMEEQSDAMMAYLPGPKFADVGIKGEI